VYAALPGYFKFSRVMRTSDGKKTNKRPEVRSLKIQPDIKVNRWSQTTVPVIRLSGLWLDKLGFTPEQRVTVTTMNKLLIIRLEE
jgi:hypothetical protein